MKKNILPIVLLLALPRLILAQNQWVLVNSTLTYQIVHPLHEATGVTHDARGQGVCKSGSCKFIVAVPVKTFDSGNSDRDLHMIETVRGAQFPMVVVRFQMPESELKSPTMKVNLQIQFAGQTAEYKQVSFQRTQHGKTVEVKGTIPMKISDFKIPPPELLFVPIKDEVPVTVDTFWKPK